MRYLFFLIIILPMGCAGPDIERELVELRTRYAPDSRTDRVELAVEGGAITGYTTVPEAWEAARSLAKEAGLTAQITVLPNQKLGNDRFGLIKVSVANLRSRPGHSQELATQALLGTPIQLLDIKDGWYLVRTPDRYLAYLEPGAFTPLTAASVRDWLDDSLGIYHLPFAETLSQPDGSDIIADPALGGLVKLKGADGDWARVVLPNGEVGYNRRLMLDTVTTWMDPDSIDVEAVLSEATKLAGRPYLWGGTSAKGLDCSGFTKTAYYMNGIIIPRDASQQVHVGKEVIIDDELKNLRRGDLLFFGTLRDDGSQRINHVGFYLGDGRMLHSGADNGRVQENNLIEGKPFYNAARRSTLLRAKRITERAEGVQTVAEAFAALLD